MKQLATPTLTALARSASSRITLADLPPSSSATFFTVPAATSCTRRPARAEPVNETMSTSGWAAIASPTTGPVPGTTLSTPAGSPTSAATAASTYEDSGATSVGLSTTVQPAASAAATLATTWCSG